VDERQETVECPKKVLKQEKIEFQGSQSLSQTNCRVGRTQVCRMSAACSHTSQPWFRRRWWNLGSGKWQRVICVCKAGEAWGVWHGSVVGERAGGKCVVVGSV